MKSPYIFCFPIINWINIKQIVAYISCISIISMHFFIKYSNSSIGDNLFNVYPIYDWKTEDIWRFHSKFKNLPSNKIYDHMHKAGVPISQQRLCQPYGDDQKKGLWLYHILEPETWFKLIARVNGANSGALYVQESGNITGSNKISKPDNHTWKSFCNLLLKSLPKKIEIII